MEPKRTLETRLADAAKRKARLAELKAEAAKQRELAIERGIAAHQKLIAATGWKLDTPTGEPK